MIAFLRTALAGLFLLLTVPPGALILFPWTYLSGKIDLIYATAMAIARAAVWLTGTQVEVRGLEQIDPKGTYIFMANHVSNLDPPILITLIPRRTSVLVKKELWKIPILGRAFTIGEFVPVDRRNRDAAIDSIRRAGEVMRHGINMMVYPEGTRSLDGRLLPFKKGPFHLAMETGIAIVPVTILGTAEIMPKGSAICKSGTATVIFHPPIDPRLFSSREELMKETANVIESALPVDKRKEVHPGKPLSS
ncbi:MAG TPA: lysophospholipid acyltransferase family protein [Candidatus Angelobacter sp.]|jgi:1-acyl-sn-glycerol-3-phosphate acyltransferase|nr:lysophospholipid acyltransferase family protein [Candidatus Angelobacter sp.]